MTIDRARNSYDATRDWRAVLAQQGRVTLEADVNEQAKITGEERRQEAIDIIGPVGSPDGGYAVSVSSDGSDVLVGPGTLYLGGWRVTLPPPAIASASQPGWLDMSPWPAPTGNQSIALLLIEQTVIAVEDTALLEVALGGPDSAARLRLLQHVLRIPTTASTCLDAAAGLVAYAKTNGQAYDQATGELTSTARLQVTPVNVPTTPGPCDPPAQGGYLQADNQMIRVAVTQYDPTSRQGTLIWGWNNASFLYRATLGPNDVLTFLADPVDPDHQPQQGQAVEILRCTVDLGDGDRSTAGGGNFITAGSGVIMTLAAGNGYNSANRKLTLPGNLLPPYTTDGVRPLFVRLWQAEVTFSAGTPVTLGDTGLSVTITNPPLPGEIGARPFWQFAVRPSTPTFVYPQRYLTAGQPPDGPRQFLADLGVVGWSAGKFTLIADCVPAFPPLTQITAGEDKAIHVTNVRLAPNAALPNDSDLPITQLFQSNSELGLVITCDTPIDPVSVSPATCFVEVEVPYPLTDTIVEQASGGFPILGYERLILPGTASVTGSTITWRLSELGIIRVLYDVLSAMARQLGTSRLRVLLVLKGNTIWAQNDPTTFLDGEAFGITRTDADGSTHIGLRLPQSGDGKRGGDFEFWFWLLVSIRPSNLAFDGPVVTAGTNSTGSVTLSGPAPSGGAVISLTSRSLDANGAVLAGVISGAMPASVTVPSGQTSATFLVDETTVPANAQSVTLQVTATYSGDSVVGNLTINRPLGLATLAFSPASLLGNNQNQVTGTITLSGPAPAGGAAVTLASNNTQLTARLPASVTVAAGPTATFTFAPGELPTNNVTVVVQITGSYNATTAVGSFSVTSQKIA